MSTLELILKLWPIMGLIGAIVWGGIRMHFEQKQLTKSFEEFKVENKEQIKAIQNEYDKSIEKLRGDNHHLDLRMVQLITVIEIDKQITLPKIKRNDG